MAHMNSNQREKEVNVKRARGVPNLLPNGRPLPCRKTLPSRFLKRYRPHSALSVPGFNSVVNAHPLHHQQKHGSRKESTEEPFKLDNYGHYKEKLTSFCHNANSPMHRLQTAFDLRRPEQQHQGKRSAVIGRPLAPAPFLPNGLVKRCAENKLKMPLSGTCMNYHVYDQPGGFTSESKKKRNNINSEQTRSMRRRWMRVTEEEKLFLEATAAMSVQRPTNMVVIFPTALGGERERV
jgi:hypothetical protein